MSSKSHSRLARRMDRSEIERQELAGAIRHALPRDGRVEMQPGLTLFCVSTPTEPVYGVSESSFCVVAQGAKHVMLGEDRFRYDPNHYLGRRLSGAPTVFRLVSEDLPRFLNRQQSLVRSERAFVRHIREYLS